MAPAQTGKESGHEDHGPAIGDSCIALCSGGGASGTSLVYWAGQGFIPDEDVAMRKVCEDYMKESGNKLEYSLLPFMALNQTRAVAPFAPQEGRQP
jgi:hypothetical protein